MAKQTQSPDINELINKAAEQGQDFTQEKKGGDFERVLPEAGMGVCRFREYVELGTHDTATKAYPNKKPAKKARFVFELTTPKHVREVEKEDGTKFKIPHFITIECAISASEKSNFIKLFRQMNWEGTSTHPAQLLGKPFLCEIVHAWAKGDDPKKDKPSYANLQKDGVYTIAPPRKVDPLAGTVEELAVPELLNPVKLFLWDMPTKDTWESLFIDGTYERDGKEFSKNWIQEKILGAKDFPGSALETMLQDIGELSTGERTTESGDKPVDKPVDKSSKQDKKLDKDEDKGAVKDPLADLGI